MRQREMLTDMLVQVGERTCTHLTVSCFMNHTHPHTHTHTPHTHTHTYTHTHSHTHTRTHTHTLTLAQPRTSINQLEGLTDDETKLKISEFTPQQRELLKAYYEHKNQQHADTLKANARLTPEQQVRSFTFVCYHSIYYV